MRKLTFGYPSFCRFLKFSSQRPDPETKYHQDPHLKRRWSRSNVLVGTSSHVANHPCTSEIFRGFYVHIQLAKLWANSRRQIRRTNRQPRKRDDRSLAAEVCGLASQEELSNSLCTAGQTSAALLKPLARRWRILASIRRTNRETGKYFSEDFKK